MTQGTKSSRIVEVNEIIRQVSSFGRRFFYCRRFDRIAFFEQTAGGRIRFVDDFTNKRVNPFAEGRWVQFSHGGTIQALVSALATYVDKGTKVSPRHFGPWSPIIGGDLWGYGFDEMENLRAAIADSPCLGVRAVVNT